METIKNIAAILGVILSLASVITLCSKPIKAYIANSLAKYKKEQEENNHNETIKETLTRLEAKIDEIKLLNDATVKYTIESCRDDVREIFFKYLPEKTLPYYVLKHVEYIEDIYVKTFHKNHYTKGFIDEMKTWTVDYTGVRPEDIN